MGFFLQSFNPAALMGSGAGIQQGILSVLLSAPLIAGFILLILYFIIFKDIIEIHTKTQSGIQHKRTRGGKLGKKYTIFGTKAKPRKIDPSWSVREGRKRKFTFVQISPNDLVQIRAAGVTKKAWKEVIKEKAEKEGISVREWKNNNKLKACPILEQIHSIDHITREGRNLVYVAPDHHKEYYWDNWMADQVAKFSTNDWLSKYGNIMALGTIIFGQLVGLMLILVMIQ